MFSAISLFVLACAITINAQSQCSEVMTGVVPTSRPVKLPTVTLQQFVRDFEITIPPIPECNSSVSGVHALICDGDVAPAGYFQNFSKMELHRKGNLQSVATATVTVYCMD